LTHCINLRISYLLLIFGIVFLFSSCKKEFKSVQILQNDYKKIIFIKPSLNTFVDSLVFEINVNKTIRSIREFSTFYGTSPLVEKIFYYSDSTKKIDSVIVNKTRLSVTTSYKENYVYDHDRIVHIDTRDILDRVTSFDYIYDASGRITEIINVHLDHLDTIHTETFYLYSGQNLQSSTISGSPS